MQLNESFYAANNLRNVCLKHQVRECCCVLACVRLFAAPTYPTPAASRNATAKDRHACLPLCCLPVVGASWCMEHTPMSCVLMCTQDVLEVATLGELLPQLAYHLQACLHRQHW